MDDHPPSEHGELGISYDAVARNYLLVLVDLNQRPIACVAVHGPILADAIGKSIDTAGEPLEGKMVPFAPVMFHLHTLKELIAS